MKYYPEKERQADGHPGILEGVQSLKVSGFVDGDVSVDCHADDDVDGAGHEGVDEGEHEVRGEECRGVVTSAQTMRDVEESRNSGDHDTEVGDCQTQQVDIHDTLEVRSGENHETGEITKNTNTNNHIGNHRVGDPLDVVHHHRVLQHRLVLLLHCHVLHVNQ